MARLASFRTPKPRPPTWPRVLRGCNTLPSNPWEPRQRAVAARRLLEELGVHCDETAVLHDLKGFLMSSPRGTEMVVSRDLSDDERVGVYAHLIAHALLGPDGPALALAARFEYVPGRAPGERPAHEPARRSCWRTRSPRAILARPPGGGAALDLLPRSRARARTLFSRRAARDSPRQPGAVPTLTQLPAAALAAGHDRADRTRPVVSGKRRA